METISYFSLLPIEIVSIIFKYTYDYTKLNINAENYLIHLETSNSHQMKELFMLLYPKLYKDLKTVAYHDLIITLDYLEYQK